MLMDDMGWGDLGVNGDPVRETPNLDAMSVEGMLLTDFYTANPLCSPSRAALLTGRLPIRNGFYTDNIDARNSYTPQEIVGGISQWEILLPELLQKSGYRNKIVGKWHLGHQSQYLPLRHGFHEFFGSTNCHFGPYDNINTPNIAFFRNDRMIGRYFENIKINKDKHISDLTQQYITEAIDFITNQSQPFFLYWTPDSLHAPTFRSSPYVGRSVKNSSYGDTLIEIDEGIGRILDTIKKNDSLANNTFVLFTSDNGAALVSTTDAGSNGPLLCGKQTTFEGGFREPAIAWWPSKIPPNTLSKQPATIMDLFRTIATITDSPMPEDREFDSYDLSPVLFKNQKIDTNIYYYRGNQLMAIRNGNYKAHFWTFTNPIEQYKTGINFCPGNFVKNITTHTLTDHTFRPKLFHMNRDPGERYPISEISKEYKSVFQKFSNLYKEHIDKTKPGKPQLNWCDRAVMHWIPPGCEAINMCLPVPQSKPYKCFWPH
ncbi:N-acetylgalactosamine-6-sulfatase-like [Oppia nitens]|uniref:N-acetylgalactosamine-6-sulfatase-like n=1 Tax=Oppia nitens TaxID=1686743 RepID=UPI0023DB7CFE|nr:N-acetylgalactosamine-6-sulfatase-like [Oppia nitens]